MVLAQFRAPIEVRASQFRGVALMIVDQAVLSSLSLALSIVFIYAGTKAEFSLYALISSGLLLGLGVQNAVIITPLIVNGAQLEPDDRARLRRQLVQLQLPLSVIVGIGGGVATAMAIREVPQGSATLPGAVLLSVLGGWLREFRRGEQILEQHYAALLLGDIATAAITVGFLACFMAAHIRVQAWIVLLCAGTAAMATGIGSLWTSFRGHPRGSPWPLSWRELFGQVRWTLPGMLLSWIQVTAYPYFVAFSSGASAVAETAAARLFINPGLMINTAYARFLLPHMGETYRVAGPDALQSEASNHVRLVAAAALLYASAVAVLLSLGGHRFLPADYRNITPMIVAWIVTLGATGLRTVPGIILQATAMFRPLFMLGVAAAVVAAVSCVSLGYLGGGDGCVCGVAIGEICLAALLWRRLRVQGAPARGAPEGARQPRQADRPLD